MIATVLLFLAASALWGWIVFGDGAEQLEGSFLSGFLVHCKAPEWSAEAIRVVAALSWLASLGWFVLRFFTPALRP